MEGKLMADPHVPDGIRLQKVISQAGVASRRNAENLIKEGRVEVDGKPITKLGTRVDPNRQIVKVDGKRIGVDDVENIVLVLNKPVGIVSSMSDPEGRPTLATMLADYPERLFHVGRLDIDTSGLLLMTNDGELANRLMHPKYEIEKTYVAKVHGYPRPGVKKVLADGITLEDGPVKVDDFKILATHGDMATVELSVHEGRNRMVRRILEDIGNPVQTLVRTGFGPIELGRLHEGGVRRIRGQQLSDLYEAVGL